MKILQISKYILKITFTAVMILVSCLFIRMGVAALSMYTLFSFLYLTNVFGWISILSVVLPIIYPLIGIYNLWKHKTKIKNISFKQLAINIFGGVFILIILFIAFIVLLSALQGITSSTGNFTN